MNKPIEKFKKMDVFVHPTLGDYMSIRGGWQEARFHNSIRMVDLEALLEFLDHNGRNVLINSAFKNYLFELDGLKIEKKDHIFTVTMKYDEPLKCIDLKKALDMVSDTLMSYTNPNPPAPIKKRW